MLAGSVREGGVVSRTVTVKLPWAVLACVSVAVQFTVVVPIAKLLPEAGVHVTGRGPSHAAEALAWKVTVAPAALVASTVVLPGGLITGGVWSTTVTVAVHEAEAPLLSVTVSVTVCGPVPDNVEGATVRMIGSPSGSKEPLLTSAVVTLTSQF